MSHLLGAGAPLCHTRLSRSSPVLSFRRKRSGVEDLAQHALSWTAHGEAFRDSSASLGMTEEALERRRANTRYLRTGAWSHGILRRSALDAMLTQTPSRGITSEHRPNRTFSAVAAVCLLLCRSLDAIKPDGARGDGTDRGGHRVSVRPLRDAARG